MKRLTIDFGIDLGTTNSTIAVMDGTEARAIPNKAGSTITPSAVWIDKRGSLHVGAEAKERALTEDYENGDQEFKLRMGLRDEGRKVFLRSGRVMLPEELSAEVLKSLKADVQTGMGEEVRSAVITVPAAFELPQSAATRRAACGTSSEELNSGFPTIAGAGFRQCILLLEPVAASLAYGFQSAADNVYWLVYDFGGGTFDAALMRVHDGLIQVVNHDGDNHLGGKLIDWDIVTVKLIPALNGLTKLDDFRRGNPSWQKAIGRLKYAAEKAKIEVCRTRAPYEIWIEGLCEDSNGNPVDFSYTLTPEDVITVARPYVERSLGLCLKVLRDKGLTGENLDKVLMVGGTTLNPWIREMVAEELGAPLEFSIDPVTVVARGAAIFAGTQRLLEEDTDSPAGTWHIGIEHEPVGNVPDPDIGGKVRPPEGCTPAGCTIEFVDVKTRWRSGRITLGSEGVFMTQLYAEGRRRCEYDIELCDATGSRLPATPEGVAYTIGVVPDKPPASNTIGIGLASDEMHPYIRKGTRLPTRGRGDHRTTLTLHAGHAEDMLRIPVLEGEKNRATRNHCIGDLVICGTDIRRDLPVGSMVEVTVLMDESQRVMVRAYIEALDDDFSVSIDLQMQHSSLEELRAEVAAQQERLRKATGKLGAERTAKADAAMARIEDEKLIPQVLALLEAAAGDPDALQQLDRRVRDLASAVDDIEDAAEWPELLKRTAGCLKDAEGMVGDNGDSTERIRLSTLREEYGQAVNSGDPALLRRVADDLDGLWYDVADRLLAFHVVRFNSLADRTNDMNDSTQAANLVSKGRRAIELEDVDTLRATNRQLRSLLPKVELEKSDRRKGDLI